MASNLRLLLILASYVVSAISFLWPKPFEYVSTDEIYRLEPEKFKFVSGNSTCSDLDSLYQRYMNLIFKDNKNNANTANAYLSQIESITSLDVYVTSPCDASVYPSFDSDESYGLDIGKTGARLIAEEIWGAIRGIETFSQLVGYQDGVYFVNRTSIVDFPHFKHRGLLLDTARHFIPVKFIKMNLDAMSYAKLNVFHWHIVDDESFPYNSVAFPDLSLKGAFPSPNHEYSQSEIRDIVEYARVRGIRVIPEFDSPDHTQSWGKGYPLLTQCVVDNEPTCLHRLIDPTQDFTWKFWKALLQEIYEIFPDEYVHLGGDEVDFSCWYNNPNITDFMLSIDIGDNYTSLENYYFQRLFNISNEVNKMKKHIVWEEVFQVLEKRSNDPIYQVWLKGSELVKNITSAGYKVLYSACWYLNYIKYGPDWESFYFCDPLNFNGTVEQKKLVIGGEACVWGEYVDATNLLPLTWPRAATVAERLWSHDFAESFHKIEDRLDDFRCLLIRRGIPAKPIKSPSFCSEEIHM